MKGLKILAKISVVAILFFSLSQFISCEEALEECVCPGDFPYSTDGTDSCYETKEVCEDSEGVDCFVCL